jgi:hypothetical protein
MLISEIITMARSLWREAVTDDILTDVQAIPFVNQAVIKIRSRRSDSRIDDNGNLRDTTAITAAGDTFPLDEKFQLAAVYFLTAHGFGRSADLQNLDKRFGDWMGLYEKEVATA